MLNMCNKSEKHLPYQILERFRFVSVTSGLTSFKLTTETTAWYCTQYRHINRWKQQLLGSTLLHFSRLESDEETAGDETKQPIQLPAGSGNWIKWHISRSQLERRHQFQHYHIQAKTPRRANAPYLWQAAQLITRSAFLHKLTIHTVHFKPFKPKTSYSLDTTELKIDPSPKHTVIQY